MSKPDDPILNRIEMLEALLKVEKLFFRLMPPPTTDKNCETNAVFDNFSSHLRKMMDRLGEDIDGK